MEERESPFGRTQPSRSSIRPSILRKAAMLAVGSGNHESGRQEATSSRASGKRLPSTHATALDNLKQWELVEDDDKGLQVVEKKSSSKVPNSPSYSNRTPMFGRRTLPENTLLDMNLEEKLKAFKNSKIIQPILDPPPIAPPTTNETDTVDSKTSVSLDLILKQQQQNKNTPEESTDMLERLERQVKAIEMGMMAAARTRQLENSTDFGPEVELRYREHEDLLKNVTDDEAEGEEAERSFRR